MTRAWYIIGSQEVWILNIEHQYGTNTSAYSSEKLLHTSLYEYVKKWWKEGLSYNTQEGGNSKHYPAPKMPDDHWEAIIMYFEQVDDEYYNSSCVRINDKRV